MQTRSDNRSGMRLLNILPRMMHVILQDYISETALDRGLNHTQIKTLIHIHQAGSTTMTPICRSISLEKGSMTTVVDQLVDRKLVERTRDRDDRRKVVVSITEQGKALAEELHDELSAYISSRLSCLTEREVADFWDAVSILDRTTAILQEKTDAG